jgi:uncharacterized protein (DUF697 family)
MKINAYNLILFFFLNFFLYLWYYYCQAWRIYMVEKKEKEAKEESTRKPGEAEESATLKLVHRYVLWSMGAGLIPVPGVDLGVLAALQLRLVQRLSQHYEVKLARNLGKSIIAALLGTVSADILRRSSLTSLVKSIPLVGVLGSISMPLYSGAATYAIGKVFIQHFEAGGTFLNFDPKAVKEYFAHYYKEGQTAATDLKAQETSG